MHELSLISLLALLCVNIYTRVDTRWSSCIYVGSESRRTSLICRWLLWTGINASGALHFAVTECSYTYTYKILLSPSFSILPSDEFQSTSDSTRSMVCTFHFTNFLMPVTILRLYRSMLTMYECEYSRTSFLLFVMLNLLVHHYRILTFSDICYFVTFAKWFCIYGSLCKK